jgi:hypothetical protein
MPDRNVLEQQGRVMGVSGAEEERDEGRLRDSAMRRKGLLRFRRDSLRSQGTTNKRPNMSNGE